MCTRIGKSVLWVWSALLVCAYFYSANSALAAPCNEPLSVPFDSKLSVAAAGPICPEHPELPPEPEYYDAEFDSQNVPTTMVVGQRYNVSISMRNTGAAVWSADQAYSLGSQNPHDNLTWGIGRVAVPGSISIRQNAKFNFTVTAPRAAGRHNFQWRMVRDGVAWFGFNTKNVQIDVVGSVIRGAIDGISNGQITGWACSSGISESISVHVYLGGQAGAAGAVNVGAYRADNASEPAIASACGAAGSTYRFYIPIQGAWTIEHANQPIYVHGISPVGAANLVLAGSGNYRIPANVPPSISMTSPTAGTVVGEGASVILAAQASDPDDGIASVTFMADGAVLGSKGPPYQLTYSSIPEGAHSVQAYARDTRGAVTYSPPRTIYASRVIGDLAVANGAIFGWACSTYVGGSIPVHVYFGGPAGSGFGYGEFIANIASEAAVNNQCKGGGTAYRFNVPITHAMVRDHGGKKVYVHGISPLVDAHLLISNSGNYALPVNQAPSITLTSPGDSTVDGPVDILLAADARDPDDAVAQVAFFRNDQLVASVSAAPWQYTMNGASAGTYRFHAVATDHRGASTRSNSRTVTVVEAQSPASVTRSYVYDAYQRLCKTIEPETGSSVVDYDAAGNVAWSAGGLDLPGSGACNRAEAAASGRRVDRSYDVRNRISSLQFPDGNGSTTWSYTPDGLVAATKVLNDGGATSVLNSYQYNSRRQLTTESVEQPGWYAWAVSASYNANGHRATQTWPTGAVVEYSPNALGQPTRVGNYATGVRYHPNGAVKQFIYGNNVLHAMEQNVRQLPARVLEKNVLDYRTTYDAVGNVTDIYDDALGAFYNRHMSYDSLDRLTAAGSNNFGGDFWHRFTYDALDNLRSWVLPGVKDHQYFYDARNRLTNVRGSDGATTMGLTYDAQGNLAVKNGQSHIFDFGNRLRSVVGLETYRYDAAGRRVLAHSPTKGNILWQYTQDGRLVYQSDGRVGTGTEFVHLGDRLIARRDINGAGAVTTYLHTDALGSIVASSDQSRQVVERTHYEPYGAPIGKVIEGPAYTGHVMDGITGLSYMQQRYMDPQLGAFLSVDPVTAYQKPVDQFNRYRYANGNPYKFTDPDGRQSLPRSVYETDWTKPETRQAFGDALSFVADFTPVVSDAKGIAEAVREPTLRNFLAAAVGVFPIAGDFAGKAIKSADQLIDAAGKMERLAKGKRQGRVEGDVRQIFAAITEGGVKGRNDYMTMPDGTIIGSHVSKSTGVATIDINKAGQVYKIRVEAPKQARE